MKSTLSINSNQPQQSLQSQKPKQYSEQPELKSLDLEAQSSTASGDIDQFLNLVFMDFTWNRY